MSLYTEDDIAQLSRELIATITAQELDRAEAIWFQLRDLPNVAPSALAIGAFIPILRNQPLDALHFLNTLPDDCCPDLKIMCTYLIGDPIWHLEASTLADSDDPLMRTAMRQLLETQTSSAVS
jgi:type III secretion protein HrpB1